MRLSPERRKSLETLACLGTVAVSATLARVHGARASDPRRPPFGIRPAPVSSYARRTTTRFLHDGSKQAAYSLDREEHRAETHLRIGRALLASVMAINSPERRSSRDQLNRVAATANRSTRNRSGATINLALDEIIQAIGPHESGLAHFSGRHGAVGRRDWSSQYELLSPVARVAPSVIFLSVTSTSRCTVA